MKRTRGTRRYWRRLIVLALIVIMGTTLCVTAGVGALTAFGLTTSVCRGNATTPTDYGEQYQWEDVEIDASVGGRFKAFFIKGTNNAVIIFPPPLHDGRSGRLKEAIPLVDHGYNVIIFESKRCAGMGPISLGYEEVSEVKDVLDYLNTRDDIDPNRIGIHGFSSAGATSIMSAARYPQIRAVLAEGGYAHFPDNLITGGGRAPILVDLYRFGFRATYQLIVGNSLSTLSPVSVIDEIAPRPVLLIYGTNEVSLDAGYQQYDAAGDTATFWLVEGAGHGAYIDVAREEYIQRMTEFFDAALLTDD